MKYVMLVTLFLLSACGSFEAAAQGVSLATPTLAPTISATALPPTEAVSSVALDAAEMNMAAAADNLRAASIQATAIVDAAKIAAAASDRKAQSDESVAQYEVELQKLKNIEKEIEYGMSVIAMERDRIHNESIGLDIRKANMWATYLTGAGLVLLALAMFAMAWVRWQTARPEDDSEDQVDDDGDAMPGYPAGIDIRLFTASLSVDVLRAVAKAVNSGTAFTHDALTPGIIREAHMATLQHLMTKYGLAKWNDEERHQNGCAITPRGKLFFEDLIDDTKNVVK